MRVFVHLDFGRSPERWAARFEKREVWDPCAYGYGHAHKHVELAMSHDAPESSTLRYMRLGLYWLLGFDLVHAYRNRRQIVAADWVWTHTERQHLAVLLLLRMFRSDARVICQTVWLWDRWESFGIVRRSAHLWLLRRGTVHTTLSVENAKLANERCPRLETRSIPYGIGVASIPQCDRPDDHDEIRILAAGNDIHRDWSTLSAAVELDPRFLVRILSRKAPRDLRAERVEIAISNSVVEMSRHLEWCDVVVVPLLANSHASGITAAMEGIVAGRPVVIRDIGGVREYFGDHVFYYDGTKDDLRRAIDAANSRPYYSAALSGLDFMAMNGLRDTDYAARHVLMTFFPNDSSALDLVSSFQPIDTLRIQGGRWSVS